jgi:hypothetical protein
MEVDRTALKKLLTEQGMPEEQAGKIAMRARITIDAVVHRACERCGGYTAPQLLAVRRAEESPATYPCTCMEGPRNKIERRGVVSDSGPRKAIPRLLWRAKEAIKRNTKRRAVR